VLVEELMALMQEGADSPSGAVTADAWCIFPKGVDRDELHTWFAERHSLGIEHLNKLTA
jgi:hypothetical protein